MGALVKGTFLEWRLGDKGVSLERRLNFLFALLVTLRERPNSEGLPIYARIKATIIRVVLLTGGAIGGYCAKSKPEDYMIGAAKLSSQDGYLFESSGVPGGIIGVVETCPRGSWVKEFEVKSQFTRQDDLGVIGNERLASVICETKSLLRFKTLNLLVRN